MNWEERLESEMKAIRELDALDTGLQLFNDNRFIELIRTDGSTKIAARFPKTFEGLREVRAFFAGLRYAPELYTPPKDEDDEEDVLCD